MLGLRGGRRRSARRRGRRRRRRRGAVPVRATVAALLRKDLQLELRTFESVPAMMLFSVTTFVLFHFGLDRERARRRPRRRRALGDDPVRGGARPQPAVRRRARAGRLRRLPARAGRPDGAVRRQGASRCSSTSWWSSSSRVPAFAILLLGPSLGRRCPSCCSSCSSATPGIAVIGTLVAALAMRTRARDLSARCSRCRCSCRSCSPPRRRPRRCCRAGGAGALPVAGWRFSPSMIWSSGSSPMGSSTSCWRTSAHGLRQRPPRPLHRHLVLIRRVRPRRLLRAGGRRPGRHPEDLLPPRPDGDRRPVRVRRRRDHGDPAPAHGRPALGPALVRRDPPLARSSPSAC